MDTSEFDDFKIVITKSGYTLDDFEFNKTDQTNYNQNIYAKKGFITIKRKSTQKEKSYNTGHGKSQIPNFETDLNSGFFD